MNLSLGLCESSLSCIVCREDFNLDVLNAFVNLQELQDMLIVSALRQFLWSFRLPGEAQKIDRMMEKFAERYCDLNPGIFTTTGRHLLLL